MSRKTIILILAIILAGIMVMAGCPAPTPTPTPTPSPKPSPTPTPTSTAFPSPTPTGSPAGIKFEFKSITDPAPQAAAVTVIGQTEANAECTLQMWYSEQSGGAESKVTFGTPVQKADATGKVQWDGMLNANAYAGKAKLQVTVKSGTQTGTFTGSLNIVPRASPTPTASASPAPTGAAGIKFEFVSVTPKAGPLDPVTVIAQTEPNAECEISTFYPSGSVATIFKNAPPKQTADATGKVQWNGAMYTQVAVGKGKIVVKVTSGGKTAEFTTTWEITAQAQPK